MSVLQNFSILIVVSSSGLGLCGPVAIKDRLSGRQVNSWAYTPIGFKYCGSPGASNPIYGKRYGKGDTVGCGINMQTGKMFFTKNGFTLGEDCTILLYTRNCFLGLMSLTNHLQKGVAFSNMKGILFPAFRFNQMVQLSVNFGKSSFVYDIAAHNWAVKK